MDVNTDRINGSPRKRFGRLGFFAALNISCLILGCMLIGFGGNKTLAVLFFMAPLTGVLSWFANRAREDNSSPLLSGHFCHVAQCRLPPFSRLVLA